MRDVVLADPADQAHDPVALFTASRLLTEHWLTEQIAIRHGVTWDQARGALHNISPNLVFLLDSPQGVTTLGYLATLYLPGVDADANPLIVKAH